ncbi:hypothetical protein [Bordetella sp. FB-8]|nr:hypothetical protein [Bordetella sp. FB-8]
MDKLQPRRSPLALLGLAILGVALVLGMIGFLVAGFEFFRMW